jgi:pimeloyl-ACP methyl ester carboxylesterase
MTATLEQTGQYTDILGVKTFYIKKGTGDPILLIHGGAPGACTLVQWRFSIDLLAEAGFTVYGYDQPGYGLTDPPSNPSMDFRVAHALACLDAWGVARAHLVGNSIGAYLAARFALEHPERTSKLVIVASGSLGPPGSPATEEQSRVHSRELREYTPSLENMRELFSGTIFNQALLTDELVQLRYEMSARSYQAQRARAEGGGGMRPLVDELRQIKARTLVVWGAQDRGSSLEKAVLVFQCFPGAELHIFDQCAHWPMWDHTERFNTVLCDFLRTP